MAEFIDGALDSIIKSTEDVSIRSLNLDIKIPEIQTNLDSVFEKIGMEGQKFDITKLDDGTVQIKNSKGEVIDYKSAKEKMDASDFKGALKDLKVPDEVINDPKISQFSEDLKILNDEQIGIKSTKDYMNDLDKNKSNYEKLAPNDVKSPEDLDRLYKENPEFKKFMDNAKEETEDKVKKNSNSTSGKWTDIIKTTAFLAALTAGGIALYEFIKKHQNECNGCWLIDDKTGSKCKVEPLTCNSDYRTSDNLCKSSDLLGCDATIPDCSGATGSSLCFQTSVSSKGGTCMKFGPNPDTTKTTQVCVNCLSQCGGSDPCNNCSCSTIQCPSGKHLQCMNLTWMEALGDLLDKPFDSGFDILQKILKIVGIALLIILGLFLIYILISFLFKLNSQKHSENAQNNSKVKNIIQGQQTLNKFKYKYK